MDGMLNDGKFNANGMQNTKEKNQHHLAVEHGWVSKQTSFGKAYVCSEKQSKVIMYELQINYVQLIKRGKKHTHTHSHKFKT